MTDRDTRGGLETEPLEFEDSNPVRALTVRARALDTELFGWAGRTGWRRHHQWLVAACDRRPGWCAVLAAMIQRHPAAEQGWLLHTPYGTVLIPGHHQRVPEGAEKVQVARAGLFPLGRKWQPFEDWFCVDDEGVVWANDMAARAVAGMEHTETIARYAAEVLVAARTVSPS